MTAQLLLMLHLWAIHICLDASKLYEKKLIIIKYVWFRHWLEKENYIYHLSIMNLRYLRYSLNRKLIKVKPHYLGSIPIIKFQAFHEWNFIRFFKLWLTSMCWLENLGAKTKFGVVLIWISRVENSIINFFFCHK